MKNIFLLILILLASSFAKAEKLQSLAEHMRSIESQMVEIQGFVGEYPDYPLASVATRSLRGHLVLSVSLVPAKLMEVGVVERNFGLIEFHQLMARIIYLAGTLESALSDPNYESESISRENDVQNILREISKLMTVAHDKFR